MQKLGVRVPRETTWPSQVVVLLEVGWEMRPW
jgi:hypothetical protein